MSAMASRDELEHLHSQAIAHDLRGLIAADGIALHPKGREHRGLCPFHEDHSPSLSVFEDKRGRQRFHCFSCNAGGDAIDWVRSRRGKTYEEAVRELAGGGPAAAVAAPAGDRPTKTNRPPKTYGTAREAFGALSKRRGKPAGWWTYEDADGRPVCLVIRWNTPPTEEEPKGGKYFAPVSRFGPEDWREKKLPSAHPLYRLPELLAADPERLVFFCEGEKCADAARRCGLLATTAPFGGNALRRSDGGVDWSPLRGRRVRVLPDNDKTGREYSADVRRCAIAAGAREVRVVNLAAIWSEVPDGGDIADLLEARGGDDAAAKVIGAEVCEQAGSSEAEGEQEEEEPGGPEERRDAPPAVGSASPAAADRPRPFEAFPIDALPAPLSRFVSEAAGSIGCEASMVALPLLASLAAAVGNARCCEVKPDWTEPSIVWAVIVGESGCGKSPAMRAALDFIKRHERMLGADHARAEAAHAEATRDHEEALAKWRRTKQGEQPREPGEAPRRPRILTTDATVEALADLLQHNPRGLLLARDEVAGLFAGFDKYTAGRGGDAQKYLEAWDGGSWIVDRKQAAGARVEPVSLSITGGIQPAILRAMLEERRSQHRENGLAARLLIAFPPRRAQRWSDLSASPEAVEAVRTVFDRLLGLELRSDAWGNTEPRRIPFDHSAREVFIAHHDALAVEAADLGGHLAAVYSKLRSYLARLSLLFHLVRRTAGGGGADAIDAASVRAAARLVGWFGGEARRFEQSAAGAEDLPDAEVDLFEVERIALDQGGEVSARHLYDRSRQRFRPMAKARAAMRAAADAGLGRVEVRRREGSKAVEVFILAGRTEDGRATAAPAREEL